MALLPGMGSELDLSSASVVEEMPIQERVALIQSTLDRSSISAVHDDTIRELNVSFSLPSSPSRCLVELNVASSVLPLSPPIISLMMCLLGGAVWAYEEPPGGDSEGARGPQEQPPRHSARHCPAPARTAPPLPCPRLQLSPRVVSPRRSGFERRGGGGGRVGRWEPGASAKGDARCGCRDQRADGSGQPLPASLPLALCAAATVRAVLCVSGSEADVGVGVLVLVWWGWCTASAVALRPGRGLGDPAGEGGVRGGAAAAVGAERAGGRGGGGGRAGRARVGAGQPPGHVLRLHPAALARGAGALHALPRAGLDQQGARRGLDPQALGARGHALPVRALAQRRDEVGRQGRGPGRQARCAPPLGGGAPLPRG
eukprot:2015815-Rhodomonas_salina.1